MVLHETAVFPLLLVALSLVAVYKTSDWVIRYAMKIAETFNLGTFAVGALFVAVSTSLPELLVTVLSVNQGSAGVALGNIIGSNIANISLLLGIAVLVGGTLVSHREEIHDLVEILFITSVIPIVIFGRGTIGLFAGITLLLVFFGFSFKLASAPADGGGEKGSRKERATALLAFGAAISLLLIAAHFFVRGASETAALFGFSEELIGLTVVAIGTSLPELSVAINGMKRGEPNVVLGNLVGSNITNLTLVFGILALTQPAVSVSLVGAALAYLILPTLFVWYRLTRHERIRRRDAIILLVIYAAFLIQSLGIAAFL